MTFLEPKELLKKLISFESLSTQETQIVDWLENYSSQIPHVRVERHENNLMLKYGKLSDSVLLFNTHTDVVPPSPHHAYPPFSPFEKDGKIYGRGSTDAKGCLTAMLSALTQLAEKNIIPSGETMFAFTACEEAYGDYNGVNELNTSGFFDKVGAAIVGEPTSLAPCIAQKGILLVDLVLKGKSGHAARISNQDNLMFRLPDILNRLATIDMGVKNDWIGPVKLTPTRISGGTANNMAPEEIKITVDIRTIPEVSSDSIIGKITSVLPEVEVVVRSDRFKAASTQEDAKIAQVALFASEKSFFGSPTCSDWAFLTGIPAIKIGPGHSEQSHTADESIEIDQLEKGVELYKNIILEYWN